MAKEYANGFYKSKRWQKCRLGYLASKHYICERCGLSAKIVHHKEYITPQNIDDPEIILSWNNLEALCQDCHNKEHMISSPCVDGLRFNTNGELVSAPD